MKKPLTRGTEEETKILEKFCKENNIDEEDPKIDQKIKDNLIKNDKKT